jgi:alpha-galactosidase/6-phospho-beta-glucosidase family protein
MKLTVIGGGGVRAPLLVASALRRAEKIGLDELCLMEIDPRRLELIGGLCQQIGRWKSSRAVQALMAHPLVLSYSRAASLVAAYIQAHAAFIGEWK